MLLEFFLILAAAFAAVYLYATRTYNYWTQLGVRQVEPVFPLGTFGQELFAKKHGLVRGREEYERFRDVPVYGTYFLSRPRLVVKDPEVVKHIFVKDFDHFVDRMPAGTGDGRSKRELDMVWALQMFSLTGDAWKQIRATFSPIFTSGKLKGMIPILEGIAERLVAEMGGFADRGDMLELKETFGKYSMDAIASCAFGVDAESFGAEESKFVKSAKDIFSRKARDIIVGITQLLIPGGRRLLGLLGVPIFKPSETQFFIDSIRQTIRYREDHPEIKRNDMLDIMIDCLKSEVAKGEETSEDMHEDDQFERDSKLTTDINGKKEFDELLIVATALVVTIAGYDTTASALAYLGYYLAKKPELQDRLQEELDAAFADNGGKMPGYNVIQGLPYLDMVIHEALRMHPPLAYLQRYCVKDYKIPGTEVALKKGDMLYINVTGIHYDENFYPNPTDFNPENFSKEGKATRSPLTFLSFGQGPRACIGMRFALLEAKLAAARALREFRLLPCERTVEAVEPDPAHILGLNKEGLWVRAERRHVL